MQNKKNEKKQSVWILEQYNQWFSYDSRIPFGVFTSREKAHYAKRIQSFTKISNYFL